MDMVRLLVDRGGLGMEPRVGIARHEEVDSFGFEVDNH